MYECHREIFRGGLSRQHELLVERRAQQSIQFAAVTVGVLALFGCGSDGAPAAPASPAAAPTTPAPPAPPPAPDPPAAPAGLRVSEAGGDFIEWTWNAVSGVSGYQVQYSPDNAFTDADEVIDRAADQTSYRREDLPAATTAHLRVRSASGMGEERIHGAWSMHATGMTAAPSPPATATTWRGLTVAPEERCAPYDADDYRYPQSVENEHRARPGWDLQSVHLREL